MITLKLEIDDEVKEYSVPTTWEDVTVKQIMNIYKLNPEQMNPLEHTVTIMSILTGIDIDDLFMLSEEQFVELSNECKFINEQITPTPKDYIVVNGEEYWLKKDYEKLTLGEVVSIKTIMEQVDGDINKAFDKLLCIFLRKKKENGNLEGFKNSFMDRAEMFGNINITDVYNCLLFFSPTTSL